MRNARLAKVTLVMTSIPLQHVLQCLFTFALVSASRWLAKIWQLNRRQLEVEFKFQRRSCKLSFLFPPLRQSTPESLLAGAIKREEEKAIPKLTAFKVKHIVGCYSKFPFLPQITIRLSISKWTSD